MEWIEPMTRLMALRADLLAAIPAAIEEAGGHCKSYEGTFTVVMPNAFEHERRWVVALDCYIIGPSRHYDWHGETLADAVTQAETAVRGWLVAESEAPDVSA